MIVDTQRREATTTLISLETHKVFCNQKEKRPIAHVRSDSEGDASIYLVSASKLVLALCK